MATIQSSLRLYILSLPAITDLIGVRMYAVRGPTPLPTDVNGNPQAYIVYRFVTIKDANTLSGAPGTSGHLEIEAYAPDYDVAWLITENLRGSQDQPALAYFKGVMAGGTDVLGCLRIMAYDDNHPQQGMFKVCSEFQISWKLA